MSEINISDVTVNGIDNTGVFDYLMAAVNAQINDQFQKQRLTGTDYATVYLGAMQSVLEQSIAFTLQVQKAELEPELLQAQIDAALRDADIKQAQLDKAAAEIALLEQKLKTEKAQIIDIIDGNAVVGAIGKQKELQSKQIDGYTRDAEQKLLGKTLDNWATHMAVGGVSPEFPNGLDAVDITEVVNVARAGIGLGEAT